MCGDSSVLDKYYVLNSTEGRICESQVVLAIEFLVACIKRYRPGGINDVWFKIIDDGKWDPTPKFSVIPLFPYDIDDDYDDCADDLRQLRLLKNNCFGRGLSSQMAKRSAWTSIQHRWQIPSYVRVDSILALGIYGEEEPWHVMEHWITVLVAPELVFGK